MPVRGLLGILIAAAALAVAIPAHAVETANLDGVWEGPLHFDEKVFAFDPIPDAKGPPTDVRLRIEIHGPVVNVLFGNEPGEGTPGVFHIAQVKTNAVIFGTDYSRDDGPGWTESMAIIVTPKDDKTLLVSFSRLVSNSGFDGKDDDNTKFGIHIDGELKRVRP